MKKVLVLLAVLALFVVALIPAADWLVQKGLENPGKGWAADAIFTGARLQMLRHRYDDSHAALTQAVKLYPESKRVDATLYRLALCSENLDILPRAIAEYQDFLQRAPKHRWVPQARRRLELLQAQQNGID